MSWNGHLNMVKIVIKIILWDYIEDLCISEWKELDGKESMGPQ